MVPAALKRDKLFPRGRVDPVTFGLALVIAMSSSDRNAILNGLVAGAVLLTVKWVQHRWRRGGLGE
jgi:hypothetical protein